MTNPPIDPNGNDGAPEPDSGAPTEYFGTPPLGSNPPGPTPTSEFSRAEFDGYAAEQAAQQGPDQVPGPIDPQGSDVVAPPKRRRGVKIGLSLVLVLALLAGLAAGFEMYARHKVTSCISDAVKKNSQATSVDVRLPSESLLLDYLKKDVSSLGVTLGDGYEGLSGLSVDLQAKDIDLDNDNTIGDLRVEGQWTLEGIKAQIAAATGSQDATVTIDEAAQTISVETSVFFTVTAVVKPQIVNNSIEVKVEEGSIAGISLPTGFVQQIVDGLVQAVPVTPEGLVVQDLKLTADGVAVLYTGQNIDPKNLTNETGGQDFSCT